MTSSKVNAFIHTLLWEGLCTQQSTPPTLSPPSAPKPNHQPAEGKSGQLARFQSLNDLRWVLPEAVAPTEIEEEEEEDGPSKIYRTKGMKQSQSTIWLYRLPSHNTHQTHTLI